MLLALALPRVAGAQEADPSARTAHDTFRGTEEVRYLRSLELSGAVTTKPWSIETSAARVALADSIRDTKDPWLTRLQVRPHDPARWIVPLPTSIGFTYNSAFPDGTNDGAPWFGRGATVAASGGFSARQGALSLVFYPTIYWSQNSAFELRAPSAAGLSPFRDPLFGASIDSPERFGEAPFVRFDPGQSTARLDYLGLEVGASTANRVWGPAARYNLVLGLNAAGFPHVFLGSSRPRTTPLGSIHGQLLWGALRHSAYAPEALPDSRRFATGWALVYMPPGIKTLELGVSRFYHLQWPTRGEFWATATHPFDGILAQGVDDPGREGNQLASVFARWGFPSSGVEFYGEYLREDYSYRLRDFVLEPDHTAAYMVGMAKVWRAASGPMWAVRAELLNSAPSQNIRVRYHGPPYVHHVLRQGHTHVGQALGAPAAIGGSGFWVRADRYDGQGRWSASVSREVQGERLTTDWDGSQYPAALDVVYAAGVERLFFWGPMDVSVGAGAAYELNRYLDDDAMNLSLRLEGTFRPWAN